MSSPPSPPHPHPQTPPLLYDSQCQNFQLTEGFQTVVKLSQCFSRYTGVSPPPPPPPHFMTYSIRIFSLLKVFKLLSSCFSRYTHVPPPPTLPPHPNPPPYLAFPDPMPPFMIYSIRTCSLLEIFKLLSRGFSRYTSLFPSSPPIPSPPQ